MKQRNGKLMARRLAWKRLGFIDFKIADELGYRYFIDRGGDWWQKNEQGEWFIQQTLLEFVKEFGGFRALNVRHTLHK